MNPRSRQLISEFIIAVAACAGAQFFLIAPAQSRLDETNAQIARLESEQSSTQSLSVKLTSDQAGRMAGEARQIAEAVARLSLPASDDAALFQAVTSMAQKHRIRINQLQPDLHAPLAAAPSGATEPGTPTPPADSIVRCDISAVGDYARMTDFLAELCRGLGFTTITSLRIEPDLTPGTTEVKAYIRSEHRAFDASAVPGPDRSSPLSGATR